MEPAPMVCFSYEMHIMTIGFRNAGLKDSKTMPDSTQ